MQRLRSILAISLIPVSLPIASTEAATVVSVDVVRVIDGATLAVAFEDSQRKLCLFGIDAPEYDQDGGMAPVDHLKWIVGKSAIMRDSGLRDRHGTILGDLAVDGTDVGLNLLEFGVAWRSVSREVTELPADWARAYQIAESVAKHECLGLKASERPIPPWTWRKYKYEILRDAWFSYTESLEGTGSELRETSAEIARFFLGRKPESETAVPPKNGNLALFKDNFIEEQEHPTCWKLALELGEGISRWLVALIRKYLDLYNSDVYCK